MAVVCTIGFRFPWWTPAYLRALVMLAQVDLLEVDADAAAKFIVSHGRVVVTPRTD